MMSFPLMVQYLLLLLAILIFFAQLLPTYNYKNNRVIHMRDLGGLFRKYKQLTRISFLIILNHNDLGENQHF